MASIVSADALEEARKQADARGVGDRLVLHEQDAGAFASERGFDVVMSVGATHAFGGLTGTLATAREHLAPGGRVLVGDAYWEAAPSAEAREMLGEYEDLATTMDRVAADGWTPVFGHISTRRELDDYEWHWTGTLAEWALDHPGDPLAQEALATATGTGPSGCTCTGAASGSTRWCCGPRRPAETAGRRDQPKSQRVWL